MWTWLNEDPAGSMVFSWFKVFASVVLGLFLADGADVFAVDSSDARLWVAAGIAAVLPLIINFLNPHDTRYGLADHADVEVEGFDAEEYKGE